MKESLERDAGPAWRASWASARGRAAWSELSRPRPRGVPGQARAETVKRVAAVLGNRIREAPKARPRGDPAGTAVTRTR